MIDDENYNVNGDGDDLAMTVEMRRCHVGHDAFSLHRHHPTMMILLVMMMLMGKVTIRKNYQSLRQGQGKPNAFLALAGLANFKGAMPYCFSYFADKTP